MSKKITALLICLFLAASFQIAKAQEADAALKKAVDKYIQFSQEMQVDSILKFIYPRLYEIAPKPQIRKAFIDAFNSKEINLKFNNLVVKSIEPVQKFSKGVFTKLVYTGTMIIKLNNVKDSSVFENTRQLYKQQFGAGNVTVNTDGAFEINTTENVVAIKDNYSKLKWTFLSIKPEQQAVLKKIIPLEIRKKYNF